MEYVDLGLPNGLKWAACNLGATKLSESGGYYAWGETEPKNDYSWETYKWATYEWDLTRILTKYNGTDGKKILDPEDDAATVKLGSPWRMPTTEMQMLIESCSGIHRWTACGLQIMGRTATSSSCLRQPLRGKVLRNSKRGNSGRVRHTATRLASPSTCGRKPPRYGKICYGHRYALSTQICLAPRA